MAKPLPDLLLSDWAVLGLVADGPTHGWSVVRELRVEGSMGRVWTVARGLVYRSLSTLATQGLIEECADACGPRPGPQRTTFRTTRAGGYALRRWLETPVVHVRDVRTELLLKLALCARLQRSSHDLIERQLAQLSPVIEAVRRDPVGDGFDETLASWRREQALAVERFLRSVARL